jgi:hypothetical protein
MSTNTPSPAKRGRDGEGVGEQAPSEGVGEHAPSKSAGENAPCA